MRTLFLLVSTLHPEVPAQFGPLMSYDPIVALASRFTNTYPQSEFLALVYGHQTLAVPALCRSRISSSDFSIAQIQTPLFSYRTCSAIQFHVDVLVSFGAQNAGNIVRPGVAVEPL